MREKQKINNSSNMSNKASSFLLLGSGERLEAQLTPDKTIRDFYKVAVLRHILLVKGDFLINYQ